MSIDVAARFFATLSLVAAVGALALVGGRFVPAGRNLVEAFRPHALRLAALVTVTASLGSLYFSEVKDLQPCRLCWFQRTMMYPLAVILLIAAVRKDHGIRPYALVLAGLGFLVATYHYLIEWGVLTEGGSCDPNVPCSALPFERQFGFVSLASMAMAGFAFVLSILTLRPEAEPAGVPS